VKLKQGVFIIVMSVSKRRLKEEREMKNRNKEIKEEKRRTGERGREKG
jgi:hypothetical protein